MEAKVEANREGHKGLAGRHSKEVRTMVQGSMCGCLENNLAQIHPPIHRMKRDEGGYWIALSARNDRGKARGTRKRRLVKGKRSNRRWHLSSALKFKGLLWLPRPETSGLGKRCRDSPQAHSSQGFRKTRTLIGVGWNEWSEVEPVYSIRSGESNWIQH